jgi:hypothetical protein
MEVPMISRRVECNIGEAMVSKLSNGTMDFIIEAKSSCNNAISGRTMPRKITLIKLDK